MPHPATQGRETSGGNRHSPRPEPGLPNYCQHEYQATKPHPDPHRGASHRESIDINPSRIQGSWITASTNPCNHAASGPPQGREPSGTNRHYPKSDPGALNTDITNLCDYAHSYSGACAQGKEHCHEDGPDAIPAGFQAIVSAYFFSAKRNSFLSSLACFMIEINVPFASSG